jgi:hypothetical protein
MTLQPLTWTPRSVPRLDVVVANDGQGSWRITPMPRDVVRIHYEGRDADGTLVMPTTGQAYAESVDEAKIVVDVLRAGTDHLPGWREQLEAAGFERAYPNEAEGSTLACLWHDARPSGLFQIVVKDGYAYPDGTVETSVHSTYESGRASFWHNVSKVTGAPPCRRTHGGVTMRDGLPEGVDALKAGVAAAIAIRAARQARGGRFATPLGGAPRTRAACPPRNRPGEQCPGTSPRPKTTENPMSDLVTLKFVNRTNYDGGDEPVVDEMKVSRASAHRVVQWFGGYCAGDDYDVVIDGEIVEKDLNGEIQPLA